MSAFLPDKNFVPPSFVYLLGMKVSSILIVIVVLAGVCGSSLFSRLQYAAVRGPVPLSV